MTETTSPETETLPGYSPASTRGYMAEVVLGASEGGSQFEATGANKEATR